ncbi:hypothetical protein F0562_028324 [Nyssa sinensis]|uniref:Uncharacterized protein n=1 Tax=Nyssa sinensis TaxID=561372 RepID=A0A5J5B620_9ASTE|nr:hypothetical protein F0562_028324 [Nyssa sinensis]
MVFVHFVLDPIAIANTSAEVSFAARYGCLVIIEKVEQLDVGALVTIRGIGRVKIVEFVQVGQSCIPVQLGRPTSLAAQARPDSGHCQLKDTFDVQGLVNNVFGSKCFKCGAPGHKSTASRPEKGRQLMFSGEETEQSADYEVEPAVDDDTEDDDEVLVYGDVGESLIIQKIFCCLRKK